MDVDCGSARERLGRTLGGKYHLKEVLGAGGTAVVYRALSMLDGQMVAVKVLHDHLSRSEEVCRRFVREGQLGNVLDHPGTVRVLDHGSTEEKCPYLVLEFLEGESLEDRRVRQGGRLEMWETLDFCDQLLAVLEIAHAKNIVHRDIKPSNLYVTATGVLKVLDFGIARFTEDSTISSATSTKTGTMVGTPAFMPPEQALSRPRDVDARTDIWSVGATLFTLLSGEHVHIAETSSEHLVKAATLHARSLARALPGVPSNVEALVARCLAFDKNERWATATSMRTELSYVRDDPGRRIGTSTSPPPERYPSNPNVPTLVGSMRQHHDAGTISASHKLNRHGNGNGNASDKPPPSGDRISDANMSLNSHPGMYRPRRKWLLPFAVTSTVMLILMSGVVLLLAVRTTTPSQAAIATGPAAPAATPTIIELPNDPPTAATTDDPPPVPPTPPTAAQPTPARPASASVNTSPTTVVTLTPAGGARPVASGVGGVGVKKQTAPLRPSGPVNKDVYRPF